MGCLVRRCSILLASLAGKRTTRLSGSLYDGAIAMEFKFFERGVGAPYAFGQPC